MRYKPFIKLLLLLVILCTIVIVPNTLADSEDNQTITITNIEQNTITINTEKIASDKSAYYIVYNADNSSQICKADNDNSNIIQTDIEDGTTLFVKSFDSSDKETACSSAVTVYTSPVVLGENELILQNDIYANEILSTKGKIYLNTHTLYVFKNAVMTNNIDVNSGVFTVGGNLIHSNGTLTINKGQVNILGDYSIIDSETGGMSFGKLKMVNPEDKLNVDGNFTTDSIHCHTGYLTDGVIRLKGNFGQVNSTGQFMDSRYNFDTDENFKIIFCGNSTQKVYFYDPKRSQFSIWEIENTCEKPMEITNGFGIRTLKQDSIIPCDVAVWSHLYNDETSKAPPIDLNGHTLHVKGNLMNRRVNMRISKGKLIVEGDYRLQAPRPDGEGGKILKYTYGTLRMLYDEDYVLVKGDFYQDSYYSHAGCMIAGTLELKGDFYQITTNPKQDTHFNFDASGTHKVILSGDGVQTVNFEDPDKNQFNILEIAPSDKPGHMIVFTSEWHANQIINNSTMTALLNWAE